MGKDYKSKWAIHYWNKDISFYLKKKNRVLLVYEKSHEHLIPESCNQDNEKIIKIYIHKCIRSIISINFVIRLTLSTFSKKLK